MKNTSGDIPPLIIIGMHRSGTNLITRYLMQLGFFMGWLRDGNSEAFFYQKKNEAILDKSGATWDNPGLLDSVLRDKSRTGAIINELEGYTSSCRSLFFWGPWRWAAMKSGAGYQSARWGWKDPRNTFTLPLWLALYPEAKVIHVVRNGVDIAASLRKREQKRLNTRKRMQHFSQRCLELEGGFSLWEEYAGRGLAHERELGGHCLRIQYEEFLTEPLMQTERLVKFLELDLDTARIDQAAAMINGSRGNAYQRDPELTKFFNSVKASPLLRDLGYGDRC